MRHCTCRAILNENAFMNTYDSQQDPYDQYEVAVPLEIVGDCIAKVQLLHMPALENPW